MNRCLKLIDILLNYQLAVVAIEVEECSVGDKHLENAAKQLQEHFDQDLQLILFHLKVYNSIGLIRSSFSDYEKALFVLQKVEHLYKDWTACRADNPAFRTSDLNAAFHLATATSTDELSSGDSNLSPVAREVEKEYTQTVYYMAQVLEKMGQSGPAAKYCTQTLVRQFHSGDFDFIDWSVNAATLSQYYACHNMFLIARRLLAVAEVRLDKVPDDDENELLKKRHADLDRIFVKYCMILLDKEDGDQTNSEDDGSVLLSISDEEVTRHEQGIPVAKADSCDSALAIFLFANKRLANATNFFTLSEHASDHADCVLDQSRLYQLLIQFQSELGKICKMHKRRIDLLQQLLADLNPVYFMSHVRRILFEIAEAYSEMVHYKTQESEKLPDLQAQLTMTRKVNSLIIKAIEYFKRFINTYRDQKTGHLPNRFDSDEVRPILIACFTTGRLHTKKMSSFPNEQLQFWTECESCYKQVVDYIESNPDQENLIQQEVKVIREMLPLIPEKKKLILTATIA